MLELYLEGDLDKEKYRSRKAAFDAQSAQLEQLRGAATREIDAIIDQISTIGGLIAKGAPKQRKDALAAMFERIEVDHRGEITRLAPREWAKPLFDNLPNKSPAEMAGPDVTSPIILPP